MTQKYPIINPNNAIYTYSGGFGFGDDMLTVKGDKLNDPNKG